MACKVTADAIYISDPNYPGDTSRYIPIGTDSNGCIAFGAYDTYDKIGFFAQNEDTLARDDR